MSPARRPSAGGRSKGSAPAGPTGGSRRPADFPSVRPLAWRHVVLVGLPGAGKSTVGPLLAQRLDLPFLDFDVELTRRSGWTVEEQFVREGEAMFRLREATLSDEFAARGAVPHVLAPGGGWAVNTMARVRLLRVARTVYLRVRPETAAARLVADRVVRPLLRTAADPVAAVVHLLERRGPYYEASDLVVDVDDLSPEAAADLVAARLALGRG